MIDHVVVNGCSFTQGMQGETWANHLNIPNVLNLASHGAGNNYICHSTLNYLESHDYKSSNTLVVVMWSGTSRIDVPVSSEWYSHIRQTFPFGFSDHTSNWIHTGGSGHVALFENLCKTHDNTSQCVESLQNFILLESYLQAKGYHYIFTSYANYWSEDHEYCSTTLVDPNIGYHCKHLPLYKKFNFKKWLFCNSNKDCFGEFAIDDLRHGTGSHPSEQTHKQFAKEFLLPAVEKLL